MCENCKCKQKPLFVVTAYRWADKQSHSYVVGVFDDKDKAIAEAQSEEDYRGGKYSCEIIATTLNEYLPRTIAPVRDIVRKCGADDFWERRGIGYALQGPNKAREAETYTATLTLK